MPTRKMPLPLLTARDATRESAAAMSSKAAAKAAKAKEKDDEITVLRDRLIEQAMYNIDKATKAGDTYAHVSVCEHGENTLRDPVFLERCRTIGNMVVSALRGLEYKAELSVGYYSKHRTPLRRISAANAVDFGEYPYNSHELDISIKITWG